MKNDDLIILGMAAVAVYLIVKGGAKFATTTSGAGYVKEIANNAAPGQSGYGWRYFTDGTVIDTQGNYYVNGDLVWSPSL